MKKALNRVLIIASVWVVFAISFDVYMVYLEISGQYEKSLSISNWLDGYFRGKA
jgi:hypothetical protein